MLKLVSVLIAGWVVGGWAVVTVKDLPEYLVAGRRYTLEFQVRQHRRTLMNNVEPRLVIDGTTTIPATRSGDGTYRVTFTSPQTDRVSLTIISGWGASNLSLYPIRVVPAGSQGVALSAFDRGQMLFVAKGCNACHSNVDLIDRPDNQSIKVGPELGGRHLAREYVIQKVKHPNSQIMPDLGLSDAEAAAIAAFVSGERATAASGSSR
ncbi:MAG TPA: cytochrome c [Gemmatimonadales bacterium]|nr:cytochrome c [Gemmatimonadales bacterium]